MKFNNHCVLLGLLLVLVIGLTGWRHIVTASDAEAGLKAALKQVERSEHFRFISDLVQTERHAARLENIGRTNRTSTLVINGTVDVPADTTTLDLTSPDGSYTSAMKVEDGIAYEKSADGSWQPSSQSTALIAPDGNPFTFLTDAANIRYAADSDLFPAELLPDDLAIIRIAFDVNPLAFGAQMQEQAISQLKSRNEWRNGMSLDTATLYNDMTGTGELWLNSTDHTPIRQIVYLTQPQPNGNTIEARITTDYTDWRIAETAGFHFEMPTIASAELATITTNTLILLLTIGGTTILLVYSRSRQLYYALALTLTGSFVLAPLAQAAAAFDTHRFAQTITERYAAEEESEAENPYAQPFAPTVDPQLANATANAPTLSDIVLNNTNYQSGVDTDGDGLTDDVEIYRLGTDPGNIDTDGDTISDGIEVQGFRIGGVDGEIWYLNPLRVDSNGDKIPDNQECIERVDVDANGALIPGVVATPCRDTDGDWIPDVYDYDDDNDNVPDSTDASPTWTGGAALRNSFDFSLSNGVIDRYVETVVQVRPNDDNHLHLANNVYDWPANDTDGQITRVKNDTFADHGFTDTRAANGDIRITPELEITMLWDANNPTRGLPISATVPINMATNPATFVDQAMLDRYRASYIHDSSNGNIVFTVPLHELRDMVGDRVVGWSARIPYQLKSATWGTAHQMRVVWKVTGLLDTCDPANAPAGVAPATFCSATNPQNWTTHLATLNRYAVSFQLTGLTVREDVNVETALIAEDDALTQPYARDLWHVADTLQRVFIEPTTLGDGSRLDVPAIAGRLQDGSSATVTERWGIPANALTVQQFTDTSITRALDLMTATGLGDFLRATYPAPAENDTPTVLYVQETSNRTVSIADGSTEMAWSGETVVADFTSVDVQTMASINWRPYTFTAADGWAPGNLDSIMPGKQANWNTLLTDAALNAIAGPGLVAYQSARKGAVTMATNHYIAMYVGFNRMVELDGTMLEPFALVDANYPFSAEPLFDLVQKQLADLFLIAIEEATVTIDGETILLTGFVPVNTRGHFLEQYGEVVLEQELTPAQWRGKRAASAFVAGIIAYIIAKRQGIYDFTNSTAGFNYSAVMIGSLLIGAAFFLTAFILEQNGARADVVTAMSGVALSMFSISAVAEVGRTVKLLTHVRALKQLISVGEMVEDGVRAAAMVRYATKSLKAIQSAARVAAFVGFIFDVLIEIAFFVFSVAYNELKYGSIAYNVAVARMLAGITLAVLLLGIGLIMVVLGPVAVAVFAVFMALLGIVEIILLIICEASGHSPDHFTCQGVMGSIAQSIADAFYQFTVPIEMNHNDRVTMQVRSATLADPTRGYSVGNTIRISMEILSALPRGAVPACCRERPPHPHAQPSGYPAAGHRTPAAPREQVRAQGKKY